MAEKTMINDAPVEEQNSVMIPYYVHECEMARMERVNKKWFISFLIVLIVLFITNAGWIIYENQFQDVWITQEGETDDGGDNYFNGTGEMTFYSEPDDAEAELP